MDRKGQGEGKDKGWGRVGRQEKGDGFCGRDGQEEGGGRGVVGVCV